MKSVLIYTVHKAASMFLHRLTAEVAQEFGIPYYSINNDRDFETIKTASWKGFIEGGGRTGCFGPIRAGAAEPSVPDDLSSYRVILHLRDPRDVLTSLYFSHVYSHRRTPGQFNPSDEQRSRWEDGGIDEFVLANASKTRKAYRDLCSTFLGKENVLLVKYESLTLNYAEWLDEFLSAFDHFEPRPRRLLNVVGFASTLSRIRRRLYRKHRREFTVQQEDVQQHRRQITPGDHRRKLSTETIEQLNGHFRDVLEMLDYRNEAPAATQKLAG